MARYELIGKRFTKGWPHPVQGGAVIVSPEAFYFVARHSWEEIAEAAGTLAGGPLVGLIGRASNRSLSKQGTQQESAGLPASVVNDSQWPARGYTGEAIVVSKPAIASIRFTWLGYLYVKSAVASFKVPVGHLRKKRVREILAGMGWSV